VFLTFELNSFSSEMRLDSFFDPPPKIQGSRQIFGHRILTVSFSKSPLNFCIHVVFFLFDLLKIIRIFCLHRQVFLCCLKFSRPPNTSCRIFPLLFSLEIPMCFFLLHPCVFLDVPSPSLAQAPPVRKRGGGGAWSCHMSHFTHFSFIFPCCASTQGGA